MTATATAPASAYISTPRVDLKFLFFRFCQQPMLGKTFKPKEKHKGSLPLPATFSQIKLFNYRQHASYVAVAFLFILWLNPLGLSFPWVSTKSTPNYPPPHPYTSKHVVTTTTKYIFPPIEQAPLLKELGREKLVRESRVRDASHPEIDASYIFSLNKYDDPNPSVQLAKEKAENSASDLSKAKNVFKNQDKIVYRPKSNKNYPEVIIVTAIDFEKYPVNSLTTIVQNRVDYAHLHNFGVYIRWYQEFLPWVNSFANFDNVQKRKWIRVFCLRAAMFAFPNTKYFWYLDEDGLIMNLKINLYDYVLKDEALAPIMLRDQPINPHNGLIKTYKNNKPNHVKMIFTQSSNKIETDSFIVKNDDIGKSLVDFWATDLYFEYPSFPYGPDSAITHILQWHPFCLSRSTIIPARTIAAKHSTEPPKEDDNLHYVDGDFTVSWTGCTEDCETILSFYSNKLLGE